VTKCWRGFKADAMKKTIPINTMPDGTCRTLKSQYFKNSVANFLHDGTWGATAVIVYEDEQEKSRIEDDARR